MTKHMKTQSNFSIIIVDDEPLIRKSLYEILRIEGYTTHMAASAEEALDTIAQEDIDVVVTDMKLPQMSGIQLLEEIQKNNSSDHQTEVILITGYGSISTAVEAMKKGAYDYITKPIDDDKIKIIINNIVEKKQILQENKELKEIITQDQKHIFCDMLGASKNMQRVYNTIESVASTNATTLITGESGTGKGLVAKAIHKSDQNRRDKPFVEISCGALSETLLESELFGHVKGAFTGAIKDKQGRFEYANGGTVFLDEIDSFSPSLQVKLLRVLQDGIFERVGDNVTRKTNARVIVATNRNLVDLVAKEDFREDLYYRINVISIETPPLRERKEDIDLLVDHFIRKYSSANNKKITGISSQTKKLFMDYNWPGNIRELENAIEGAIIMARTKIIQATDIPNIDKFRTKQIEKNNEETSLKKAVQQPEKDHIISVLNEFNWNRNKAAAALGVNRTTLYNKMKKYQITEKYRQ